MQSTRVLSYKYKAAIEDAQFAYTSFYIKEQITIHKIHTLAR